MDWSNDNCPVCNGAAREALPRMDDTAEIICDDCGRYRITGTATETIRHKEPGHRASILERAKAIAAEDGGMPLITSSM
jgi:hypothetical protein